MLCKRSSSSAIQYFWVSLFIEYETTLICFEALNIKMCVCELDSVVWFSKHQPFYTTAQSDINLQMDNHFKIHQHLVNNARFGVGISNLLFLKKKEKNQQDLNTQKKEARKKLSKLLPINMLMLI